jgi:RNA polymerase sigma-70 factor, ECF subfamily
MSSSTARYFPGAFGDRTKSDHQEAEAHQRSSTESRGAQNQEQPRSLSPTASAIDGVPFTVPSDEALLASICDGDTDALASLFRRYARVVRAVAYRVLRDTSEADDLLQDLFLLVQRKCGMFDPSRGPARFWILQMTYHRALGRRRYLNSRHFYTRVDLDEVGKELADPRTNSSRFDDSTDGILGKAGLEKAFEPLSENQRQTLWFFFVEGYTLGEIAAKLNQTRGNVKNHYFRGLEKLRKQFPSSKLRGDPAV